MNLKQMRQTLEILLGYYDYSERPQGGYNRAPSDNAPGSYYQNGQWVAPAFWVNGRQRVPPSWSVIGLEAVLDENPRTRIFYQSTSSLRWQHWSLFLRQYDRALVDNPYDESGFICAQDDNTDYANADYQDSAGLSVCEGGDPVAGSGDYANSEAGTALVTPKPLSLAEAKLRIMRHFGRDCEETTYRRQDTDICDQVLLTIKTEDYDLPLGLPGTYNFDPPSPVEHDPQLTFFDQ